MTNQVNQDALIANEFNKQYPYDDMDAWDRKLFKSGYQAATQASESEINSLKQRVEELEANNSCLVKTNGALVGINVSLAKESENLTLNIKAQEKLGYELTASNNQLREALEKTFSRPKLQNEIDEILSSTPAQSLAEHDNQIIQMCADKAEEMALYAGIDIAEAIRLLKVTP